jgi:hypothetical protein
MAKLRPIPAILMNVIRRQHPRLHAGYILDDEHVLLHMVDDEGTPEDRISATSPRRSS